MRNVTDKRCKENQNPHFIFKDLFSEKCAVDRTETESHAWTGVVYISIGTGGGLL